MTARERTIRVMLRILANPYQYSRKELAKHFDCSRDSIDDDIKAIKDADINFRQLKKGKHPCAIEPDRQFEELRYLQPLTDADKAQIANALAYTNKKDAFYLKKKLDSLYDFQKLGLNALRRPALERLNNLAAAQKAKKQVILVRYRSNSNAIRDRQVEAFKVDPELDTVQAFDPKDQKNKHFKLSRIERVLLTDTPWASEEKHNIKPTDVFRIAMANQIMVQLKIDVYAYNSLIDNYPKAKGECDSGTSPNTFFFQCKVNPQFLGLINFIMNNAGHVEIIAPIELKEKVRERVNILLADLDS